MSTDVDLDSPLPLIVGAAAAKDLATHLDIHTVGELVRHYPRRYLERGELGRHRRPAARASTPPWWPRWSRRRSGRCADGTARC